MNQPLPIEVQQWLASLPENDYQRELAIAIRNWNRILKYLRKN